MDFYSDPAHATLRHLLASSTGARELLKTAEIDDFNTDFPDRVFAWPAQRKYPVHTPAHAAVSYLYVKHAHEISPPSEVVYAIEQALEAYGITKEKLALDVSNETLSPEACIFPEQRSYPVRDATEVKHAEERLLSQAHKLHPETRANAFVRLAKAAEIHDVKLQAPSYQYAGKVATDKTALLNAVKARWAASLKPEDQKKYASLVDAIKKDKGQLKDPLIRIKLAETIGTLDEATGMTKHYDRHIPDPIRTVFNTSKVASADDVELGGITCSVTDLSKLPPSFFSDVYGDDIVPEIAPRGFVEPDRLKQIVDTFPADMKLQLKHALRGAGISTRTS